MILCFTVYSVHSRLFLITISDAKEGIYIPPQVPKLFLCLITISDAKEGIYIPLQVPNSFSVW